MEMTNASTGAVCGALYGWEARRMAFCGVKYLGIALSKINFGPSSDVPRPRVVCRVAKYARRALTRHHNAIVVLPSLIEDYDTIDLC